MRRLAAGALLACLPATAPAADVQDALLAGELICEFRAGYQRSVVADLLGDPPVVEQMRVYEAVGREQAKVVSTRAPGRRTVEVRATPKAVHLIERAGPSVLVTTLTGCERSSWRRGADTCVRFTARHAWHFDLLALKDPDASLERQPSGALRGACEPWQLD